jgi:hypothetical protein
MEKGSTMTRLKRKPDRRRDQPEELFAPLSADAAANRLGRRLARLDELIADLERRGLTRQAIIAAQYRAQLVADGEAVPRRSAR